MNFLYEDFDKVKFPYNESDRLEYKEAFTDNGMKKYIESICGFLNSGGGKLIFGIKDNLQLVGLNLKSKQLDKCILRIDEIIQNKQIIGIDKSTNKPININPTCIKPISITNISGKKFLIVNVIPDENIQYQLLNGKCYYRLGASNYFDRSQLFYTESDYNSRCDNYEKLLEEENQSNIKKFNQIIKNKDEEINELQSLNNQLITDIKYLTNDNKISNEIYDKYIENTIKYIGLHKTSYYDYFKNCFVYCFPN